MLGLTFHQCEQHRLVLHWRSKLSPARGEPQASIRGAGHQGRHDGSVCSLCFHRGSPPGWEGEQQPTERALGVFNDAAGPSPFTWMTFEPVLRPFWFEGPAGSEGDAESALKSRAGSISTQQPHKA